MSVIADAYLAGVSTRRVEKLVQQLGVERISKSQVSRLAESLDQIVEDFRTRPARRRPYALRDARRAGGQVPRGRPHRQRLRRARRRRQRGRLPRVARPRRRHRRGRRRLAGVHARPGRPRPRRRQAGQLGRAPRPRRRDRRDAARRLLAALPHALHAQPAHARAQERPAAVATMVRTIFAQPDAATVHEQHARIVDQLEARFPAAAALLEEAGPDLLAFTACPRSTGDSSGATTRSSGSTRRSAAAPTWSASSPTAPRSSAWSAPCSPSRTTNGPIARRYMSAESIAKALSPTGSEQILEVAMIAA